MMIILISGLSGCKPTEKNYQAAYEAARVKKASDAKADDLGLDMPELISEDGPNRKVIAGEEIYVLSDRVSPEPRGAGLAMPYNVAVGVYRMPANAEAHLGRLREEGYKDAYMVRNPKDMIYVCIGGSGDSAEAAGILSEYRRKHRAMTYPGLPDAVLLSSPVN